MTASQIAGNQTQNLIFQAENKVKKLHAQYEQEVIEHEIRLEADYIASQKVIVGSFLSLMEGLIPFPPYNIDYETLLAVKSQDSDDPYLVIKLFNKLYLPLSIESYSQLTALVLSLSFDFAFAEHYLTKLDETIVEDAHSEL